MNLAASSLVQVETWTLITWLVQLLPVSRTARNEVSTQTQPASRCRNLQVTTFTLFSFTTTCFWLM